MTINDAKEMSDYLKSILSHGLRLQNIEMEDNLSIFMLVVDTEKGSSFDAHMGFPDNESIARQIVIKVMKDNTGGIVT